MNWLFTATNLIAFTAWAALAALPRSPKVLSLVLYLGVGLLCLAYTTLFLVIFANLPELPDYDVEGLKTLFTSDVAIVLGWTHYLAFDLFIGLWIAKDADHKGFTRLVQLPFLFATLMAGPIGLLAWLITRERRARRQ
jgi:hypothetical protein